jgi:flavodoxin I
MDETGIFYGPDKGSVSKAALLIAEELDIKETGLKLIKNCSGSSFTPYKNIIFGISTLGRTNWDSEHKDDDWDIFFTHIEEVNWDEKKIAIYGLGDSVNYPNHFVDAMGWLYEKLKKLNATVVGFCAPSPYQFNESKALINGKFIGLPLDEDNEPEKTPSRIKQWISTLKNEYNF